ncbi:hypothetical protein [Azospirillum cavernae]|uniref:hypothetical protein n=1 Tax=Azospirillum cavernae TaxID=2320860 RepID=UPI0011C423CA|nr:hypothetical protein [Azospirillum cavernae]
MRCGRQAPIIFVGIAFGYFWLSIVGAIVCGFLFGGIAKASAYLAMNKNSPSKKISYMTIQIIEILAFTLLIQFLGIISSEVTILADDGFFIEDNHKILQFVLYGDVQNAFSSIFLSPFGKSNYVFSDKLWLFHSYNYLAITSPLFCLSYIFRYKTIPMKKEGNWKVIKEIFGFLIAFIVYFIFLGIEIKYTVDGCHKCGIVEEYIVMHLMGKIYTGVPIMALLSMVPVYALSISFSSARFFIKNCGKT